MRHLKILFILVILAFLLGITSCKKESKTTEVKGFVIDNTTGVRLVGARVFLNRENPDCFSCQTSKVAEYVADANGNFGFKFEHNQDFLYSVTASHINYFESFSGGVGIESGEKNTAILPLAPKAYLRVFIKNVNPYDGNDVISTGSFGGGGDSFYGMTVDTALVKTTSGNKSISIFWGVTKNNITTTFTSSVYTPSFDTTNLTINY